MYLLQLLTLFNSIHCRVGVDTMQTAAIAVINEILVISGPQVKTNLRVVIVAPG